MFRCDPRAFAASLALALLPLAAGAEQCPRPTETPSAVPFQIVAPAATVLLRVANTPVTREYGLMCVRALPPRTGMIFVFTDEQPLDFWMKNTLIPLDMVFVDHRGVVTSVAANVPATSAQTPGENTHRMGIGHYVLELAAGEAAPDGIAAGVRLDLTHVPAARE